MVRRVSAIGGDDKILQPMTNLITTYRTLNSASATMFPPFPESTLHKLVAMTSTLPNLDVKSVLRRYFPVHLHTDASLSERSESVAKKFLQENEKNISEFSLESSPKENSISVNFENGVKSSVPVRSLRARSARISIISHNYITHIHLYHKNITRTAALQCTLKYYEYSNTGTFSSCSLRRCESSSHKEFLRSASCDNVGSLFRTSRACVRVVRAWSSRI